MWEVQGKRAEQMVSMDSIRVRSKFRTRKLAQRVEESIDRACKLMVHNSLVIASNVYLVKTVAMEETCAPGFCHQDL